MAREPPGVGPPIGGLLCSRTLNDFGSHSYRHRRVPGVCVGGAGCGFGDPDHLELKKNVILKFFRTHHLISLLIPSKGLIQVAAEFSQVIVGTYFRRGFCQVFET